MMMTDEERQEIMRRQADGMRPMTKEEMGRRQAALQESMRPRGPSGEQGAMLNFWGADPEKTVVVRAGLFVRNNVRKMFEDEVFAGRKIRWIEDRHWTHSVFRLRGLEKDVAAVDSRIQHWRKCQ